jgi:lipid II:glycine glycyltransferase (peptidoglycan interpeptide bridge formation enzyme)
MTCRREGALVRQAPEYVICDEKLSVTIDPVPGEDRLRAWDDVVRSCPGADVAQLSGWARVRAVAGFEAIYAFVQANGHLIGGAQILVRRVRALGAIGYVPYGPVIAASATQSEAACESLAAALETIGRRRVRALFVQPPEGAECTSAALLRRGFRPSDANIAPSASLRIDLTADEVQLRRNLSRRLRSWTNQWAARGVTVREGGEDDFHTASEIHARTAEHNGFIPFTAEYLAAMHRELSPGGHFLLLIGEVHGCPGVMGVYTGSGGILKARLVGLDRSSEAARYDAVAAVDWAALTWAKRNGYRWFDFSGISPVSVRALESGRPTDFDLLPGPDRYKLRFGGVPFRYPQPVELIASPIIRLSYDLVRRSRTGRKVLNEIKAWARIGASHDRHAPPLPRGDEREP